MEYKILKSKKVYYGKNLDLLKNGAILIKKDKIVKIIEEKDLSQIQDLPAEIMDLGNLTIMPGLIDCHSHLNIDANIPEHLELLAWSNECELTLISLKALEENVKAGITTLRCLGDKFYTDVTLKNKILKNEILGPDILSAGLGMKGLHGSGYIGYPHCGKEEIRKTVRENLKRKVDTLKLFITPGQLPESGEIPSYLSLEEIEVAVEEGKRVGIPVAAHCIGGEGLKNCLKAGVQVLEHLYGVNDDEIGLLKDSKVWLDLTPGIFMDSTREEFLSENNIKAIQKNKEKVSAAMKKIIAANIPFTLGTDAYHGKLYKEVLYAIELGADIKDAIKAITSNAAKVCNQDNLIGSLSENYLANIIAIDGDPFENPVALSKVKFVLKRGEVLINNIKES
ncbi:MAG: amidohydrolase family protein [Cetobacterium sp.]